MSGVAATPLALGSFDSLANDYSQYRPAYAPGVLSAILGLVGARVEDIDAADVGAGTGIWTRMMAERGLKSVAAVEPSANMRANGERDSRAFPNIRFREGTGEATGLPAASADLLTMASSFHWVDFDAGTHEFCRVLRPGGWFVALWNPRQVEASPLLAEIEGYLTELHPGLERKSSGRSSFTKGLTERLIGCGKFSEVVYLEGRHTAKQTREQYIGAWRSVNDIQAQLGPEKFARFLAMVEQRIAAEEYIETTYLTCAWASRRGD